LQPSLVLPVVVPFGIILTVMLRVAIKARRAKVTTGAGGVIGLTGRARTELAPEGTVLVRSELWHARSEMTIAKGEDVRVTGIRGMTLDVEAPSSQPVSTQGHQKSNKEG
jgi:membrane-bound serine protease (ClpP class)